jgi:glucose/arabinose dehydrogenase
MIIGSLPRSLLLAGAFFGAFTFGAAAQQPSDTPAAASPAAAPPPATLPAPAAPPTMAAPAPAAAAPPPAATTVAAAPALPPGSALIGRPDNEAAQKLAPVAPPPLPTAADKLPTAKLKVPAGFNIEVYASGVANAREMALGDKGTVFVGSRLLDKVSAIVDKDGKRTVKVLASGLYRPNGVAFKDGTLYIAELSKISKIDKVEDNLDNPPKPTVIYDNLPKEEAHGWKFIAVGPDNKL